MTDENIHELNKKIRKYDGKNSFIISLQKNLKSSYLKTYFFIGNKKYKRLTDNQYEVAEQIFKDDGE